MSGINGARQHKILLIDGDVRSSQRLARLLGDDGYEVDVARDATAARARLAAGPLPDVLITELNIPLGTGVALARYARSQASGVQIFVLTSYPNLLVPAEFGSVPPTVLTKPLDYPRLLELLGARLAPDGPAKVASL